MYRWNKVGPLPIEEHEYAEFANQSCNKCYGRGFTGHRIHTSPTGHNKKTDTKRSIMLCKCINMEKLREEVMKRQDKKEKVNMVDTKDKNTEGDKIT